MKGELALQIRGHLRRLCDLPTVRNPLSLDPPPLQLLP
jgi:hypothetical protein